jgi:hypothetical protein
MPVAEGDGPEKGARLRKRSRDADSAGETVERKKVRIAPEKPEQAKTKARMDKSPCKKRASATTTGRVEDFLEEEDLSVRLRKKKASVAPMSPAEDSPEEPAEETAPEAAEEIPESLVNVKCQDLDRSPLSEGEVQSVSVGDLLRIVRKLSSVGIGMQFYCRAKKGKEIPDDLVVKRFVQGQSRKALRVPITKVPLFLATILSKKDFLAAVENAALELKMMMRLTGGLEKAEAEALLREARFSAESPGDLAAVSSFARLFGKSSADVLFAKVPKADAPEKMVIVFGAISLVLLAKECEHDIAHRIVHRIMRKYFHAEDMEDKNKQALGSCLLFAQGTYGQTRNQSKPRQF